MKPPADRSEENRIFGEAAEKLDLYVRLLAERNENERAREFCAPGGPYTRCALKEFVLRLLEEGLSPIRYASSSDIGAERVFDAVRGRLSGKMTVTEDANYYGRMSVALDGSLTIELNHYVSDRPVEVTAQGPDDDAEWKYPVARLQGDEYTLCCLEEGLDDPLPLTAAQADDFCEWIAYIFDSMDRYKAAAEEKAAALRGRYGIS